MSTLDATTVVKNRITHPDGNPMPGVPVTLIIIGAPAWVDGGKGRVLGTLNTWTDQGGCWRQEMLPYTAYRQYVYVDVRENGASIGFIEVKPPSEGKERWVFDLLIDPPTPTPPPVPPIMRLRQLHDVAAAHPVEGDTLVWRDGMWHAAPAVAALAQLTDVNITDAPDGAVLVKHDGTWTWRRFLLGALDDVDRDMSANPTTGEPLVWLGDRWGQDPPTPPTDDLVFTSGPDPADPTGYTCLLTLTTSNQQRPATVLWGDATDTTTIPAGDTTASHTYSYGDTYFLDVAYGDGQQEAGTPLNPGDEQPTIPYETEATP